jgi:Tfp pilus assembly protein PilZ
LDLIFGYGLETPRTQDLVGIAARTKNTMYGGGVIVNAHKAWKIGAEVYDTVSLTQDAKSFGAKLESVQIAFSTRLDF